MEQAYCTAVFWRGGEKIDLNGLKPDAVRCLSVTGERKVNLSFLRDYPNLEELTLMEKCEGVEVLSELKQLHTLSLWLSAPVSWDNVSLPGLRVLHLRGEKNGDITPLLSSITNLHLEEMRKTEDLTPFLTPATRLQKLYLQSLPAVQKLPALDGLPSLYAQPKDEPAKLLSELPELLQSMGLSLWRDGSDYLENSYLAYELEPVEDPEADWRLDVYICIMATFCSFSYFGNDRKRCPFNRI